MERVRQSRTQRTEEPGAARWAIKRLEDALFDVVAARRKPREKSRRRSLHLVLSLHGSPSARAAGRPLARRHPYCRQPGSDGPTTGSRGVPHCSVALAGSRAAGSRMRPGKHRERTSGRQRRRRCTPQQARRRASEGAAGQSRPLCGRTSRPADGRASRAARRASASSTARGLGARRAWREGDTPPTVVWGAGGLVSNMVAVLERRLMEASIRGLEDKPLAGATGSTARRRGCVPLRRLRRRALRGVARRPGVGAAGAPPVNARARTDSARRFRSPMRR